MELRKKLERDFQSLKGTGHPPTAPPRPPPRPGIGADTPPPDPADNFQDQMKRELAYREEMVQQLQIVRGTARPRPSGSYWFYFFYLLFVSSFFFSFFSFFYLFFF